MRAMGLVAAPSRPPGCFVANDKSAATNSNPAGYRPSGGCRRCGPSVGKVSSSDSKGMAMRFLILTTVLLSGIAQGAADKPVVIPKGETVTGLCVGVHDGDSMTLLIATPEGKRQSKIRMDAIDAPELGQPFSNR